MREIYKKLLVGLLLAILTIGTVASVNTDKTINNDKTKENIDKVGSNDIASIAINPILRGNLITNFENQLDGFGIDCGGAPDYTFVSGKIGSALKIWATGGDGDACAYKDLSSFTEGDTIFFYGKGYVSADITENWGGWYQFSHITDTATGCGTSRDIWKDCNNGQPYTNWRLFKIVADRDSAGGRLHFFNSLDAGTNFASYYDYVANIWIVPQPKDYLEFIWPGPPKSITNLKNTTYEKTYIKWTWTDPNTPDFSKVMIYINGKYKTDVVKGKQYYNSTGLLPNTLYQISTHTVDTYGNVNKTWANRTARTAK